MRLSFSKTELLSRLGNLSQIENFPDLEFPTPNCLLFTKFGAVPFLTNDLVQQLDNIPHLTFASLNFLREKSEVFRKYGRGLAAFSGLQKFPVVLFQTDPTDLPATRAVEKSSISIWAVGGRLPVSMVEYAECVINAAPAAFQAPVDNETSFRDICPPGKKRCQKAVQRTHGYLSEISILRKSDEVLGNIPILVSIAGGNDLDQRLRGIAQIDFTNASGVVLDGFFFQLLDEFGKPADRSENLNSVFQSLSKICEHLPERLPRFMTDIWQPDEVLRAVQCGVDIFDGSLPYRLSRSGLAWTYPGWLNSNKSLPVLPPWIVFPLKQEPNLPGFPDEVYEKPIQENCTCFACQRHNRAYISHLHSVNEMLAQILLMIHNSTRCYRFFSDLRDAIENSQLEEFSEFCRGHHFPDEILQKDVSSNALTTEDS